MNIAVCIKQVPDVDDIKWTKENNLDRSSMLSKLNLCDKWALDWAISIKSRYKGVKITAISMGPNQAKDILYQALAMGADRAILLSDRLFAGSDTLATSKILAAAIKKYVPDFNLILTGQVAQDGDTQQVPVGLAQLLSIPDLLNVVEIYSADKNLAVVAQKMGNSINVLETATPCLIAINHESEHSVVSGIDDYIRAQNTMIETYNAQDLQLSTDEIGVLGSPTMVYRAFRPEIKKDTVEIVGDTAKQILDFLLKVN